MNVPLYFGLAQKSRRAEATRGNSASVKGREWFSAEKGVNTAALRLLPLQRQAC